MTKGPYTQKHNIDSLKIIYKKNECFTDFRIATPPRTSVSKDVGDSGIGRMNSTLSLPATREALPRYTDDRSVARRST